MNQLIEATLEAMLERIDNGKGDWIKEWVGGGAPRNAATGRHYRGINILLLWSARQSSAYSTNEWATYKQWLSVGKQVRKDQKSSTIFIMKDALKKGGDRDNKEDHYRLLRCAFVFNREQLTDPVVERVPPLPPEEKHARCATTVARTGARISDGPDAIYYNTSDRIEIPPAPRFTAWDTYYGTLFHELVHWTGHKSRLDRGMGEANHYRYAEEELVAELGAAFLCAEHDIINLDTTENSAAYIRHWLAKAKGDRGSALMTAASAASKAVEFIMPETAAKQEVAA